MEKVRSSYNDDDKTQQLLAQTLIVPQVDKKFSIQEGILRYKGRIWVGSTNNIIEKIMEVIHNSSVGGHSGVQASYQRRKSLFYWNGMKKDFEEFISVCDVCKKCKTENVAYPALL